MKSGMRFGFSAREKRNVDPDVGDLIGSIGLPSDNHKVLGHHSYGNKTDVVVGVMPTLLDIDVLPPPDEDDLKFKVRLPIASHTSVWAPPKNRE
jgi:hypothetical protein